MADMGKIPVLVSFYYMNRNNTNVNTIYYTDTFHIEGVENHVDVCGASLRPFLTDDSCVLNTSVDIVGELLIVFCILYKGTVVNIYDIVHEDDNSNVDRMSIKV